MKLTELERIIKLSWTKETGYPGNRKDWNEDNQSHTKRVKLQRIF